jgi:hypothetical protein
MLLFSASTLRSPASLSLPLCLSLPLWLISPSIFNFSKEVSQAGLVGGKFTTKPRLREKKSGSQTAFCQKDKLEEEKKSSRLTRSIELDHRKALD